MADEQFEFELPGGEKVYTGNVAPETLPVAFQPFPDDYIRSIDEIVEIVKNPKRKKRRELFGDDWMLNQGQRNSCNAYMVGAMLMRNLYYDTGLKIDLAPEFVYMNINGNRDQGSTLVDGMKFTADEGCCKKGMVPYQSYRKNDIGMEEMRRAIQDAQLQRFGECFQVVTSSVEKCWQSLLSGIAGRGVAGMAVHVGNNFLRSGKMGGFDRGNGNHAVAGDDIVLLTDRPRSVEDLAIDMPNSWGLRFGEKGRTLLTIKHIEQPMRYHGLYICRSALSTNDLD